MPAAAVIPAPIAYIKVAAVKSSQLDLGLEVAVYRFGDDGDAQLCLPVTVAVFFTERCSSTARLL